VNIFIRLIHFLALLAHDEITAAYEQGYKDCEGIAELAKRVAYAEGEVAGRQQALEQLHEVIAARTEGMGGIVTIDDLETAKRGLLH
jgi:hypothetical protein